LQIYASGLMGLFGEPLVKVLVSNFLGPTFVGILDIGIRIRNQFGRVFDAALSPLFQLLAEMRDIESKSRIVKELTEKLLLILLPVSFMILFGAKAFVTIWIGKNIDIISMTIIIVTIGSILSFLVFAPVGHYLGVDKPIILLVTSTISNIIYSGSLLLFHKHMGYNSVYLCFIAAHIIYIITMIYLQKHYLNSILFSNLGQVTSLSIYIIIMLIVGWGISSLISIHILLLVVLAILVPILSFFIYISLSLINENDIRRYFGEKAIGNTLCRVIQKSSPIIIIKNNSL